MFAAGGPSVSAHRRSLVTATAAGALLCALWFVPTAKATPDAPGAAGGARQSAPAVPAASTQPATGSPAVPSAPSATAAHAAPPAAAAEDGVTSPFALSALGLAAAGGFLVVRACSRTAQAARSGARSAGADGPRGGGAPR